MSLLVHLPLTSNYGNCGETYINIVNGDSTINSSGYCVFNGGQYIRMSNHWFKQAMPELTVCVKAYMSDWSTYTSYGRIFSCTENGGFNNEVSNTSMAWVTHVYTNASLSATTYSSSPVIELSSLSAGWHSFAFVYTLNEKSIYVDGNLATKVEQVSYGLHFNKDVDVYLGCESASSPTSPYFNGYIKDFRIYDVALPQSIINFIHKSDSYEVILNGGLGIPTTINTPSFIEYDSSSLGGKGFTNSTGSTQSSSILATCNGAQSWSGVNTFNYGVDSHSCTGFNDEGFLNKDASMIVQNINKEYLAGIGVANNVVGDNVYNAVWNDLVDCIEIQESLKPEFGYCYCFDGKEYHKSSKYRDDGIVGIHSNTYGMIMGDKQKENQLKIAVAGFVLAYVDKEYEVGTPLTCTEGGVLTELKIEDMEKHPESLVATFYKKEDEENWNGVFVDNRMWVKVK